MTLRKTILYGGAFGLLQMERGHKRGGKTTFMSVCKKFGMFMSWGKKGRQ